LRAVTILLYAVLHSKDYCLDCIYSFGMLIC